MWTETTKQSIEEITKRLQWLWQNINLNKEQILKIFEDSKQNNLIEKLRVDMRVAINKWILNKAETLQNLINLFCKNWYENKNKTRW